jgi:hypothetical protein
MRRPQGRRVVDIVKEAADPALYPSVLGSALQQLNRLTIYPCADAGESDGAPVKWGGRHVLHRTWVCLSDQVSKGRSGNALAVRGDERRGTLR